MRLRVALSYVLVIGVFLGVLTVAWFMLDSSAALQQLQSETRRFALRLQQRCGQAYTRGGWPQVRELLSGLLLPPGTALALRVGQADPEVLQGELDGPNPLLQVTEGEPIQIRFSPHPLPARRRFQLLLQVGPAHDPAWVFLGIPASASPELRAMMVNSLLRAGALAAAAVFLVGLALSSLVAGPVKELAAATEALGRVDLSYRVPVRGRGELAQLAHSFNRMAQELADTLDRLRQEKDRAEQLEASRREFLADVSHNLKTPLAAIQGWTEALQDGLAPGEEQRTLELIHRETRYVAQTVQRLLALSRWDSDEPMLSLESFPISEPLMAAVDALAEPAEQRDIRLTFSGLEGQRVRADLGKVRELFQIFLENAVYHAGPGSTVEVSFSKQDERLLVEVCDDGAGLPQELLTESRSRYRQGLGLAIAHKLVDAHGSSLELDSPQGRGTRVRFWLPLASDARAPEGHQGEHG